jgi:hypothetical protein
MVFFCYSGPLSLILNWWKSVNDSYKHATFPVGLSLYFMALLIKLVNICSNNILGILSSGIVSAIKTL